MNRSAASPWTAPSVLALAAAAWACAAGTNAESAGSRFAETRSADPCAPPSAAPTVAGVWGEPRDTTVPTFAGFTDSMAVALGLPSLRLGCSPGVAREIRIWSGFGGTIPDVLLLRLTEAAQTVDGSVAIEWPSPIMSDDPAQSAAMETYFQALFGCAVPTRAYGTGSSRACSATFERAPDWARLLHALDSLGVWTIPNRESLGPSALVLDGWSISVELRDDNGYRTFTYNMAEIDRLEPGPRLQAIRDLVDGAISAATRADVVTRGAMIPRPQQQPLVDRGVGIVHLARFPSPDAAGRAADTIAVQAEPRAGADLIARFILRSDSATWGYDLEGVPPAAQNMLEYGYEELGLPADSAPRAGGWVRVVHGFADDSTPSTGWVRLVDDVVVFQAWAEVLAGQVLFFVNDADIALRDAPAGEPVAFPLHAEGSGPGRRLDYILYPLEARGDWLRVRAVTPSDYCADPQQLRDTTVWVRYLNERGRPNVWYHTRGC